MSINTIPISRRTLPTQAGATANGSYTLPQYLFLPDPSIRQVGSGTVLDPTMNGMGLPTITAHPTIQNRPYPVPFVSGAFAIRSTTYKAVPEATAKLG